MKLRLKRSIGNYCEESFIQQTVINYITSAKHCTGGGKNRSCPHDAQCYWSYEPVNLECKEKKKKSTVSPSCCCVIDHFKLGGWKSQSLITDHPRDRGAWQATFRGVVKSRTQMSMPPCMLATAGRLGQADPGCASLNRLCFRQLSSWFHWPVAACSHLDNGRREGEQVK